MTPDKAIEILKKHGVVDEDTTWGDYLEAVQLGIEALKAWKKHQAGWVGVYRPILPGETKE